LATVDLGLAINQKMDIDHSLRAGSEGAMIDLGQTEVRDLVEGIAAESLEVQSDDGDVETDADALAVSVSRFCACPENVSATVDCSTGTCEDAAKPYLYYRLSAEMQYDPFLLPEIPLRGSVLVQVK
jgi:pilus assembly protein CpaE